MRVFSYILVALIINVLLFESFPYGGSGTAIGVLVTIPIIIIATLIATGIHYHLKKKNKSTKYFQVLATTAIVLLSYFMFITEPDNTPIDVIKRMRQTARVYNRITMNDFFLENRYPNYEKIVAAKKKFKNQIPDTVFAVQINKAYKSATIIASYGILYTNGKPISSQKNIIIEKMTGDTFRFKDYLNNDTITFYGNPSYMSNPIGRTDSFMNFGVGHSKDTTIREASIDKKVKGKTPDEDYFAYRVFYWLL